MVPKDLLANPTEPQTGRETRGRADMDPFIANSNDG
jgi:hypothetical protein